MVGMFSCRKRSITSSRTEALETVVFKTNSHCNRTAVNSTSTSVLDISCLSHNKQLCETKKSDEVHSEQLTTYERNFSISKLFEKLSATRAFHRTLPLHFIIGSFWSDESKMRQGPSAFHPRLNTKACSFDVCTCTIICIVKCS